LKAYAGAVKLRSPEQNFGETTAIAGDYGPMLARMNAAARILCFSPHPDDTEFSAGGFLAKAAARGSYIGITVVSDGRKGSVEEVDEDRLVETRKREQDRAAKILGVNKLTWLGFRDSEIPEPRILRPRIMESIRSFKPDLVITLDPNLPYEAHLDHVYVGRAVMESVLLHSHPGIGPGTVTSKRPTLALAATSRPNVIVNIDTVFPKKIQSIQAHESQMDSSSYLLDTVREISALYGKRIGCRYAEPFIALTAEEMHMNIFPQFQPE
jgi:LmbE family N-acetylglucosaminyl deacetylase